MKYIIAILLIGVTLFSCIDNSVPSVDFDVKLAVAKDTFKVGDTITFNFKGNPDYINFYPGIPGYNYSYQNRNLLTGKTQLQFKSYKQNGAQENSLRLLVSTDFNGTYSKAGLFLSTWTDITDRVTLSNGADNTPSGIADVSDFVAPDKNVFFAFRKIDTQSATLKPNQWTIRSFNVDVKLADSTLYPITNLTNAGWLAVDSLNSSIKWSISSTALVCAGGNLNSVPNEDWVITKALTPLNVTPDVAIPVKWIDIRPTVSYQYIFKTAGKYQLVFVASNQNLFDSKKVVRSLNLTITN